VLTEAQRRQRRMRNIAIGVVLGALVILFYVVRLMLALLLRGGGEITERSAAFLSDLVLSPMLFLGSALLYLDQAAREKLRSVPRPRPKEA